MYKLAEVIAGTGGTLDPGFAGNPDQTVFSAVVIDSRQATAGALFFALAGSEHDGHQFIAAAVAQGATGVVVREDWQPEAPLEGVAIIHAADTLLALQAFATWWRLRFPNLRVIGITGSIGKTSTKEFTAAVIGRRYNVLKSEGNQNSETGLPLTVLRLTAEHQVAVLEMGGGYRLGELTELAAIAKPQVGVITMVSHTHLSRLGTLEKIAENKSEVVRALPDDGVAVLNYDDDFVRPMKDLTAARVIYYGLDPAADLWASDIESRGIAGVQFTLHRGGEELRLRLPLLGAHSVHTALRAAAAADAIGMNWSDIIQGIESGEGEQLRLLVVPGVNGTTLLDDSYNANPASTLAALNLLDELEAPQVAVLGDMRELGSYEEEGHMMVGRRAAAVVDRLVVVGELGRLIGEEALRVGMKPEQVFFTANNAEAIEYLTRTLTSGSSVLVKGSLAMRMAEIVQGLRA